MVQYIVLCEELLRGAISALAALRSPPIGRRFGEAIKTTKNGFSTEPVIADCGLAAPEHVNKLCGQD